MKVAVITLVLLGVVAAVSAAVLIAALTARPASASTTADEQLEVLLAARDLPEMTLVDAASVKTRKILKSQLPPDVLRNAVQVVGQVTTQRMVADQPFTSSCFAREGKGVYLATAITPGKRAMSIQLSDWSGMAGLLYPGSVVDVLVSFKPLEGGNQSGGEMMATTLLQGLQVLAIGSQSIADQKYQDKNPGALAQSGQINTRMVTLLVDPKQAEILQLAMLNGSISLAMRNPKDAEQSARRLTRAREIASSLAGGVTSDPPPLRDDPFSNHPQVKQPSPGAHDGAEWETLIIRGKTTERRTFHLDEATQQAFDSSPHAGA